MLYSMLKKCGDAGFDTMFVDFIYLQDVLKSRMILRTAQYTSQD